MEVTNPEATYRWASELLQKEYDGMDLVFAKGIAYAIDKKFDIFLEDGFKFVLIGRITITKTRQNKTLSE